ncbi:MAG: EamA family transporter [Candidatus Micrarchaeota archaeon]|nr:EamA family transporter [Candidatus Micrarchaeota archaeon]
MLGLAYIISFTLISAMLAAFAQYLFKRSIKEFHLDRKGIISVFENREVLLAIIIYIIALAVYLQALRYGELSFVYPIFASVFVFVMIISKYKLKEPVGIARIAGTLLIILGIALTALTF